MSKDHIVFKKEITLSHILTTFMMIVALFFGWAEQDKRITVLEKSDITQGKVIDKMSASLVSIDDKIGITNDKISDLISEFQFERGKNVTHHKGNGG